MPQPSRRQALAGLASLCPALALARADEGEKKPDFPVTGKTEAKYAPFDDLLVAFSAKYKLPGGASLAVARDGKVVYARGFGWADRENKQPMKPETLLRISSMSKPITAAAVMHLVEKGKLKLDARVAGLLNLKPAGKKPDERWLQVTVRHLLEHRGGWDKLATFDPMFVSPFVVNEMGGTHPAMPGSIIRFMLRRPLQFDPGEKFVYSNFGYCLLGRVIEKAGGMSYGAYVKKHVLDPLGLKNMRLGRTLYAHRAAGEARYYSTENPKAMMGPQYGKPVPAPYGGFCLEAMDAQGGWVGTATDVVTFARAFEDPRDCKILKAETVEEMFARPRGEEKSPAYYAKGWLVRPVPKDRRIYWHDGSIEGSSGMVVRRDDGVTYALLFNTRENVANTEPAGALELPMLLAIAKVFGEKK